MKSIALVLLLIPWAVGLIPPRFQWKYIDFAWHKKGMKEAVMSSGDYVPAHNMPTGIAKWRDKFFIAIPRWKKGVPSSLNYISANGSQSPPLHPYPSWRDGFVPDSSPRRGTDRAVVSAFRVHADRCDRLWVPDNGVADMHHGAKQVSEPALLIFNLKDDSLIQRYILPDSVLRDESVFSSIVVDITDNDCQNAYAYITDMGSNAIVVYSLKENKAWRVEHPHFSFDPNAATYKVGGIDFFWNDGVSSAALSKPGKDGYRDLYFQPTSSIKTFKMSTKLLRNQDVDQNELAEGVKIVGNRGPRSQITACAYDNDTNTLFFTQVSKNGLGCWNLEQPYSKEFTPLLISDCCLLEFPNDIQVDEEGTVWVLSDRQSRFLYGALDTSQVNFRVLSASAARLVRGTSCAPRAAPSDAHAQTASDAALSSQY